MPEFIDRHCLICPNDLQELKEVYSEQLGDIRIDGKLFSARRSADHVHYRMVRCQSCGLLFSSPILPIDTISHLYSQSEITYQQETPYIQATYSYYLKKHVLNLDNLTFNSAVDIGCGDGFFLKTLTEIGFQQVYGVEPSNLPASSHSKNIFTQLDKLTSNLNFDLVTCFQTIDHLPEPHVFLQQIYQKLSANGRLLLIMHNEQALSAKILKEKSPVIDIQHIYLFNPETIKQLLLKYGFSVEKTFTVVNSYPLAYWYHLAGRPFEKILGKLLQKNSLFGKISIPLPAGNFGVIARKTDKLSLNPR